MKKRSRKKHSKLLLPLIVFFLGSAGLLALCLLLVVRDTPTNPAVPSELESALDTLEKKSIPTSIQQFETPVQITREDSLNPQIIQSYKEQDINGILKKHVEAMGGRANWQKVESLQINGNLKRNGQTMDFCIIKKRPFMIRATFSMPIFGKNKETSQFIRAYDGKEAWYATRKIGDPAIQKKELNLKEAKLLAADATILPKLLSLWQSGAELSIEGRTRINGNDAVVINAIPSGSFEQYDFYLCLQTYRTIFYEKIDDNGFVSRTSLSQYSQTNKHIFIPMLRIIESPLTGVSVLKTNSVNIGVGIYNEYFSIKTPSIGTVFN